MERPLRLPQDAALWTLWTASAQWAAGDWAAGMAHSDNWVSFLLSLTTWKIVTPGSPRFLSVKWGCICSQEEYLPSSYCVPSVPGSQCWSHTSDRDRHVPAKRRSGRGGPHAQANMRRDVSDTWRRGELGWEPSGCRGQDALIWEGPSGPPAPDAASPPSESPPRVTSQATPTPPPPGGAGLRPPRVSLPAAGQCPFLRGSRASSEGAALS